MTQVSFQCYEDLNNYLPGQMYKVQINCEAEPQISAVEKIQLFGIQLDKIGTDLISKQ